MDLTSTIAILIVITVSIITVASLESSLRSLKRINRSLYLETALLRTRLTVLEEQNRHLRQEQNRAIGARYRVEGQDIYAFWN